MRLYRKYELPYAYQGNHKYYTKLHEQFTYAVENVDSIRRATGLNASEAANDAESVRSAILKHFIKFVKSLLYLGCAFFIFTLIFKNFDNKSFMDNNKFDIKKSKDMSQRLSDVKGIDEIKDEIENLIKMIREPDRYHSKGANLHKGVLLYGQPGTGKTLLARAIAGEAGCSFIYCTGSHFDEMFVGVGAKRIRELFNEAKKNKPCIIFIDEIDSLLTKSRRYSGEPSSSRATIN